LALLIHNLNIRVSNVWHEQQYQKEREAALRDTSETANSHIRNWTIIQLLVMATTCAWQLRHLKRFFIAKKLGKIQIRNEAKKGERSEPFGLVPLVSLRA
ncbi:emp24p/erv25p- protein, partial [Geranomyces michiganensis]